MYNFNRSFMVKIPANVVNLDMNSSSKLLYGVLLLKSTNNVSFETIENLAEFLNVTHMTIRKSLNELESKNLILKTIDTSTKMKKFKYEVML